MRRNQLVVGVAACVAGALVISLVSRAGDLLPPAGPVSPTPLRGPVWQVLTQYDDVGLHIPSTVVSGSGVLHSVILRQSLENGILKIRDGNGVQLGFVDAPAGLTTSSQHLFDVRYENGLVVYQDISTGSVDYAIFYLPD